MESFYIRPELGLLCTQVGDSYFVSLGAFHVLDPVVMVLLQYNGVFHLFTYEDV